MIDLTPSARQRFDDYLRRLRQSLRRASPAEADDVEQSVREHIEVALAGVPAPVGGEQLAEVLDRLGAPDGWVPADDRSTIQRLVQQVADRLRFGPEEWRLAYVTFGLFVAALILMPIGIGFFLLIASFLASRACVDYMEAKQEAPGPRRWLIYPPIGFFLVIATAFFVIGPAGPIVGWGVGDHEFSRLLEESRLRAPYYEAQFVAGAAMATLGAWWLLASLIGMAFLPVIRFIFKPLLTRLRRPHFLGLTIIGALSLALGLVLLRPWISQLW
ncbi:MAG: HAAS signaling domain-containing protein [Thermoanaerobaculia bacterium]